MVTKLYIVRHCQSAGNAGGRFQGRFDGPVNEQGVKQLELLSLRFRNEPLDAIYSSPLIRAYRTAEAINKYHGLPIHKDCLLYTSLTTRELARLIKKAKLNFNRLPEEKFDDAMGVSTGAAVIFGATGGVMEAALRTAADLLTGEDLDLSLIHILTDVACIVLAENAALDKEAAQRAELQGIPVYSCAENLYDTAVRVYETLK